MKEIGRELITFTSNIIYDPHGDYDNCKYAFQLADNIISNNKWDILSEGDMTYDEPYCREESYSVDKVLKENIQDVLKYFSIVSKNSALYRSDIIKGLVFFKEGMPHKIIPTDGVLKIKKEFIPVKITFKELPTVLSLDNLMEYCKDKNIPLSINCNV